MVVFGAAVALMVARCEAHFLWIKSVDVDGTPQGLVFFNESPADETYHFPEKLAKIELWSRGGDGKLTEVATAAVDTDERVGLIGPLADTNAPVLQASQQYGIYGQSLLEYHAKTIRGATAEEINKAGTSKDLKLGIVPTLKGEEAQFEVLWDGKPLAGAGVTLMIGDENPKEVKTGEDGKATAKLGKGGLIGVLANYLEKDKAGELGGKPYKGVMHYASLTFNAPTAEGEAKEAAASSEPKQKQSLAMSSVAIVPPMPEPVASFGAVAADGWLYVYGGHIGEEHAHSAENLSQHFRRVKLDGTSEWEELPMQTPLQGLPLVTHGGKIYRVGGLNNRNATTKDKEDLHSTAEFAEFDPATKNWTALVPLPAARSSHNAAVIGDKLYVIGGWRLEGKSPSDERTPGHWEPDALAYDFTKPEAGWQKLSQPDFKRRALGVGVWKGKLFALGGMNEKAKVSMQVDVFDPATGKWEKGPSLPGAGMAGFGVSAWNLDGDLYVCGLRGVLYRLNDAGSDWEETGRMDTPRFFHQLVPAAHGGLMVVGGASMNGHLATIEQINPSKPGAAKN
jgi:N-acetylneuraminic acid mutarotase